MEMRMNALVNRVSHRPLPDSMEIKPKYDSHMVLYTKGNRPGDEMRVGYVSWHPETGEIEGLNVDKPYRHYTNHLMAAAIQHSEKHGIAAPSWAESLTDYSYRLMKKYNPTQVGSEARPGIHSWGGDFDPTIEGLRKTDWEQVPYYIHQARQDLNEGHAKALQEVNQHDDSVTQLNDHVHQAHQNLHEAEKHLSLEHYAKAKAHLEGAHYHLINAHDVVFNSDTAKSVRQSSSYSQTSAQSSLTSAMDAIDGALHSAY
jgi:hypothetical protein